MLPASKYSLAISGEKDGKESSKKKRLRLIEAAAAPSMWTHVQTIYYLPFQADSPKNSDMGNASELLADAAANN